MTTMISVENVSKFYRLGTIGGGTLRGDLQRWWARTRGKQDPLLKIGQADHRNREGEFIWALRDVNFEVEEGEVLGIIGRNGAGKSTLLKILSRVTAPTSGEIKVDGRIASLLEVGTGFHPELTGRENIYLNGAILGMNRREVNRKFDEIVAFSEVEQFIDTPVKRYSSGMYVRLAFAVAAHLDPEILIVDEVLAVGDAAFQKKCLGKMGDVATQGRTVLFVSHNMAAIQTLCKQAVWVEYGRCSPKGNVSETISSYLSKLRGTESAAISDDLFALPRTGNLQPIFHKGYINDQPILGGCVIQPKAACVFKFILNIPKTMKQSTLGIHFDNDAGVRVLAVNSRWMLRRIDFETGVFEVTCSIPVLPLVPGSYYITLGYNSNNQQIEWLERIAKIEISATDVYGTGELPWAGQGYYLLDHEWHIKKT